MEPDIDNMTLNEYLEYEREKEEACMRNLRYRRSSTRLPPSKPVYQSPQTYASRCYVSPHVYDEMDMDNMTIQEYERYIANRCLEENNHTHMEDPDSVKDEGINTVCVDDEFEDVNHDCKDHFDFAIYIANIFPSVCKQDSNNSNINTTIEEEEDNEWMLAKQRFLSYVHHDAHATNPVVMSLSGKNGAWSWNCKYSRQGNILVFVTNNLTNSRKRPLAAKHFPLNCSWVSGANYFANAPNVFKPTRVSNVLCCTSQCKPNMWPPQYFEDGLLMMFATKPFEGLPYVLPFRADDLDSRRPDDGLWKWATNVGEHLPVLTVKWRMTVPTKAKRSSGKNGAAADTDCCCYRVIDDLQSLLEVQTEKLWAVELISLYLLQRCRSFSLLISRESTQYVPNGVQRCSRSRPIGNELTGTDFGTTNSHTEVTERKPANQILTLQKNGDLDQVEVALMEVGLLIINNRNRRDESTELDQKVLGEFVIVVGLYLMIYGKSSDVMTKNDPDGLSISIPTSKYLCKVLGEFVIVVGLYLMIYGKSSDVMTKNDPDGLSISIPTSNEMFEDVAKNRSLVAQKLLHEGDHKREKKSLIGSGYGGWLLYTAASASDFLFVQELLHKDALPVFNEGEYGVTDILYAATGGGWLAGIYCCLDWLDSKWTMLAITLYGFFIPSKLEYVESKMVANIKAGDADENFEISQAKRDIEAARHALLKLNLKSLWFTAPLQVWASLHGCGGIFVKDLELRMDNLVEQNTADEGPSKLDCIQAARNLESLRLWGVQMVQAPKWDFFQKLRSLEIVGVRMEDPALVEALRATSNLTHLVLLVCQAPKIEYLEVQGCSWIRVRETSCLKNLIIANNTGRVYLLDFGKLTALESLSIGGVQWCWDAINKMLQLASGVQHLYMKVEFTGEFEDLLPFPEIDFVDFFKSHPKLKTFDVHGAMFATVYRKNSLKNVDSDFMIPCLEEVVIIVRLPLNAEQKMNTLESLVKFGKNLKKIKDSSDEKWAQQC
ncbi:F-box domain, cyclin-like protein [Artemisia annua]|uniref:F-box domain, cyclin-like protein n=1 Tax=Artemisia annua TaxID=35608 RepID=A0A2U1MRD6_ARTAN|nr:F-box domain, cyclin-like protein [Artemisia annua]